AIGPGTYVWDMTGMRADYTVCSLVSDLDAVFTVHLDAASVLTVASEAPYGLYPMASCGVTSIACGAGGGTVWRRTSVNAHRLEAGDYALIMKTSSSAFYFDVDILPASSGAIATSCDSAVDVSGGGTFYGEQGAAPLDTAWYRFELSAASAAYISALVNA